MALAISQPCAGDPTLIDTQLIIPVNTETQEEGPTGPAVTNNLADQQAEADNPTETTPTTPEEASAPVATCSA